MHTGLIALPLEYFQGWLYVQDLGCSMEDDECSRLAVCLRKCGADLFVRDKPSSLATLSSGPYHFSRSRTIYILSKLPESPPLSQIQLAQRENDLIISSRISAVQIRLPHGFQTFKAHPASHFDCQDSVFFSTESISHTWCFIMLKGELDLHGRYITISCFFICLDWNCRLGEMVSALVDQSSCDPGLISQFVSGLEHEQHDLLPWVMHNLAYFSIPLQNSVTYMESSGTVTISQTVQKDFLPNICNNEMYQVDITLAEG